MNPQQSNTPRRSGSPLSSAQYRFFYDLGLLLLSKPTLAGLRTLTLLEQQAGLRGCITGSATPLSLGRAAFYRAREQCLGYRHRFNRDASHGYNGSAPPSYGRWISRYTDGSVVECSFLVSTQQQGKKTSIWLGNKLVTQLSTHKPTKQELATLFAPYGLSAAE